MYVYVKWHSQQQQQQQQHQQQRCKHRVWRQLMTSNSDSKYVDALTGNFNDVTRAF